MIIRFSLFLFFIVIFTTSCKRDLKKVSKDYCNCLQNNNHISVNEKVQKCQYIFANAYTWKDDPITIKKINKEIDSILSLNCDEYLSTKKYLMGSFGDWIDIEIDVETEISKEDCSLFKRNSGFFYLEPNGDTVKLDVNKNLWIDEFRNGSFHSYLNIVWDSECEFHLILIETTEPNRKKMFSKGDIFYYKIIDKFDNYFLLTVTYKNIRQQFNLYLDHKIEN